MLKHNAPLAAPAAAPEPAPGGVVLTPLEDWQLLLGAVCERLRLAAAAAEPSNALRAQVLDAVQALEHLRASLPLGRDHAGGG